MNRTGVLMAFLLLLVSVAILADQVPCELDKILVADSGGDWIDHFGNDVSIYGDVGLVGAVDDDECGWSSGSVYVLRRIGNEWVEEVKLTASDCSVADDFGCSVSLYDNTALVASADDDNGNNSGAAYVFRYDSSVWVEEAKITASDGAAEDLFGSPLCLFGDIALIGARYDDDNGTDSGSAYVFRYDGGVWIEEAKITPSDGAAEDRFGCSVSLYGDTAIVGASGDDDNGIDAGAAYVFRFDGSDWIEEVKLTSSDGAAGDAFGNRVSISGDTGLVGAVLDDDNGTESGSAYVFRHDVSGWVEEAKLMASGGHPYDHFAQDISLAGDRALVGIPFYHFGPHSGAVSVFKRYGSSWLEEVQLVASPFFDQLNAVSLSGDLALVGEPRCENFRGAVYFFGLSSFECGTISGSLTCEPLSGIVPFHTRMSVRLINDYDGGPRDIAGRIDVTLSGGQFLYGWRAGYANVPASYGFFTSWDQTIPAMSSVVGENLFTLVSDDVTPSPFNQPPYPPSGDTDTDACTVTATAP